MTAGWPGRPDELAGEQRDRPRPEGGVPPGPLDHALLHRARAINADALRVIDELLDQIADSGRK
ncbi:MAG TPA: hypothetical protein VH764_12775 [Gemmatimonadales bacterium]|jgi:hypothetical protein